MIETVSQMSSSRPKSKTKKSSELKKVVKGLISKHSTLSLGGNEDDATFETSAERIRQKRGSDRRTLARKRSSINTKRAMYKRERADS